MPIRKFCIFNNHLLWKALQHTIAFLNLTVTLYKILKAYAGDIYNDTADILAKEGAYE
jgi:hypothetical protein